MPSCLALVQRSAPMSVLLPFAVFLVGACGVSKGVGSTGSGGRKDSGQDVSVGSTGGGGATGAGGMDGAQDPPNTAGLGPAAVNLGDTTSLAAVGSYVLLAKTGITNVTGSSIIGGHLGISPAAASFITGFSLIADSTNLFATSVSVVPPAKVYASDYAVPTPSNLTSAILSMQTAYTDAAGRTKTDFLNLGSGEIGGQTLVPGLYTWGSSVTIATDVTISGGAEDSWLFQIANDLDLSAAKKVTLAGGAQARNVFWQVAGQVTIHANAHFEGNILCQTAITLQTTASMKGRALAQTLIALDDNAITAP
jgi:hypothetical protein